MSKNNKKKLDGPVVLGLFIFLLVIVFFVGLIFGVNATSKSIDPEVYCGFYEVNKDKLGDNFTEKDISLFARDIYIHYMDSSCKRNCSEQEMLFGDDDG